MEVRKCSGSGKTGVCAAWHRNEETFEISSVLHFLFCSFWKFKLYISVWKRVEMSWRKMVTFHSIAASPTSIDLIFLRAR